MRRWYLRKHSTFEGDSDAIQYSISWDFRSVRVDGVEESEFWGERGLGIWKIAVGLRSEPSRLVSDGDESPVPQRHWCTGGSGESVDGGMMMAPEKATSRNQLLPSFSQLEAPDRSDAHLHLLHGKPSAVEKEYTSVGKG